MPRIKQITSSTVHPGSQMKDGEWSFARTAGKVGRLFHKFKGLLHEFWSGEPLFVDGSNQMRPGSILKVYHTRASGDSYWIGDGTGVPYGSMSQENVPTTVSISPAGTFEIVTGMTGGETNLATFQNSRELKVAKAGRYLIVWAVSFSMTSGSGQECEGAIGKNAINQAIGSAHRTIGTGNDTGSMGGTGILDLAADDVITVMVTNQSSTVGIVIAHASLTLMMVGGS